MRFGGEEKYSKMTGKDSQIDSCFQLHKPADKKEAVMCAIDQHGCSIEGGSLAEYLRETSPGADSQSDLSRYDAIPTLDSRFHGY